LASCARFCCKPRLWLNDCSSLGPPIPTLGPLVRSHRTVRRKISTTYIAFRSFTRLLRWELFCSIRYPPLDFSTHTDLGHLPRRAMGVLARCTGASALSAFFSWDPEKKKQGLVSADIGRVFRIAWRWAATLARRPVGTVHQAYTVLPVNTVVCILWYTPRKHCVPHMIIPILLPSHAFHHLPMEVSAMRFTHNDS